MLILQFLPPPSSLFSGVAMVVPMHFELELSMIIDTSIQVYICVCDFYSVDSAAYMYRFKLALFSQDPGVLTVTETVAEGGTSKVSLAPTHGWQHTQFCMRSSLLQGCLVADFMTAADSQVSRVSPLTPCWCAVDWDFLVPNGILNW